MERSPEKFSPLAGISLILALVSAALALFYRSCEDKTPPRRDKLGSVRFTVTYLDSAKYVKRRDSLSMQSGAAIQKLQRSAPAGEQSLLAAQAPQGIICDIEINLVQYNGQATITPYATGKIKCPPPTHNCGITDLSVSGVAAGTYYASVIIKYEGYTCVFYLNTSSGLSTTFDSDAAPIVISEGETAQGPSIIVTLDNVMCVLEKAGVEQQ
jgi:hypothetical protein